MATTDGGAAVAFLLPVTAKLHDGSQVLVETDYPFEDTVKISYTPSRSGAPLYVRVPSWAKHATINGTTAPSGQMFKHVCPGGRTTVLVLELAPEITVEHWARPPPSTRRYPFVWRKGVLNGYSSTRVSL